MKDWQHMEDKIEFKDSNMSKKTHKGEIITVDTHTKIVRNAQVLSLSKQEESVSKRN